MRNAPINSAQRGSTGRFMRHFNSGYFPGFQFLFPVLLILLSCEARITTRPGADVDVQRARQGNRPLMVPDYRRANTALRGIYTELPEPTIYCNCNFDPKGKWAPATGCSFSPRDPADRDIRYKVHWEHVVPASRLAEGRSCWDDDPCIRGNGKRYGGRSCCRKTDTLFRAMEADLHNLRPAIGEINRHRQNYSFEEIPGEDRIYGACDMEISSNTKTAEPPESSRGLIARTYLYMDAVYGIGLTYEERKLYENWHRLYRPTSAEVARDIAIRELQGNSNPFIYDYRPEAQVSEAGQPIDPDYETVDDKMEAGNSNRGSCLLQ